MQASRCVYIEDVHAEENSRNNTSRPRETLWILSSEHVKPFFEVKKLFCFSEAKFVPRASTTRERSERTSVLKRWVHGILTLGEINRCHFLFSVTIVVFLQFKKVNIGGSREEFIKHFTLLIRLVHSF